MSPDSQNKSKIANWRLGKLRKRPRIFSSYRYKYIHLILGSVIVSIRESIEGHCLAVVGKRPVAPLSCWSESPL